MSARRGAHRLRHRAERTSAAGDSDHHIGGLIVGHIGCDRHIGRVSARAAGPGRQVRDGDLVFEVLAVQAPIPVIVGTHAEFTPRGEFVRVRVVVRNSDVVFHELHTDAQRLVDAAGRRYEPSADAMRIKRQPDTADLGSQNRLELDLWFDIPKHAVPRVLVV